VTAKAFFERLYLVSGLAPIREFIIDSFFGEN